MTEYGIKPFGILRGFINISANLTRVIKNLYSKATKAVYLNGDIGDWFRTTVGVKQGCLLPSTLLNIFLERIMTENRKITREQSAFEAKS